MSSSKIIHPSICYVSHKNQYNLCKSQKYLVSRRLLQETLSNILLTSWSYLCLQLNDKFHEFVTESDKEHLIARLQEVEDWLYEDGEDETKGVYVAKLDELKKVRSLTFFNSFNSLILKTNQLTCML